MSNYSADSFGLTIGNSNFIGYARNLLVSTSEVHIPLIGIGLDSPQGLYGTAVSGSLIFRLDSPLPSTVTGALSVYIKNFTTGWVVGYVTIGAGGVDGSVETTNMPVSDGDQVALVLVTTGGSAVLPFCSWVI